MIDDILAFSQKELLFVVVFTMAIASGIYVSLRYKVQAITTLLLMLTGSIVYLVITNLARISLLQYSSDTGACRSAIIIFGIFGVLITIKILKKPLRLPAFIIHHIFSTIFLLFLFYQVTEYLLNSRYSTEWMLNFPLSDGSMALNFFAFQQTASILPGLYIYNGYFSEFITALMAIIVYLYFAGRFKHPVNSLSFAILIFMTLLFISLFKLSPSELPAFSNRLMGLNVIQWGLLLVVILFLSHILSIELDPSRRKREILKKAPSGYTLLIFYLLLTFVSFQVNSLFSQFDIKVLLINYFITSSIMVIYFFKKIERSYLRYGTVSIILLTFILFIHVQVTKYQNVEIQNPNTIIAPSINKDQPVTQLKSQNRDGVLKKISYTAKLDNPVDSVLLVISTYQVTSSDGGKTDRIFRSDQ